MTNDYYDQRPGEKYGHCVTCGLELQTKEDAKAHRTETFEASGAKRTSHSTRATNPTREENVHRVVDRYVNEAIDDLMQELSREVDRERLTEEEIRSALAFPGVELVDAWNEWRAENDDDDEQ